MTLTYQFHWVYRIAIEGHKAPLNLKNWAAFEAELKLYERKITLNHIKEGRKTKL